MMLEFLMAVKHSVKTGVGGPSIRHQQTFPLEEKYYPNVTLGGWPLRGMRRHPPWK